MEQDLKVVELVFSNGEWRPARLNLMNPKPTPLTHSHPHPHPHLAPPDTRLSALSNLPSALPSGLRVESGASKSGSSGTGSQLRRPPSLEAAARRLPAAGMGSGRGRPRAEPAQLPQSPLKRGSGGARLPPTLEEQEQPGLSTGGAPGGA